MTYNITGWLERADAAIELATRGFKARMGYEPGAQEIRLRSDAEDVDLAPLPAAVRKLFGVVHEISWPDIWNGYFIGPATETIRCLHEQNPGFVAIGREEHRALVLGSDGGGAYFVLDLDAGGVILHVTEATIHGRLLSGEARLIASDFEVFLESLIDNVEAFANDRIPNF